MSTSDRVCPDHGDRSFLPTDNFCTLCGKKLEMKSSLRGAAENMVQGAAVGLGVGIGLDLADDLMGGMGDALYL